MVETENKAVLFWLSGIGLSSIHPIMEVETLMRQGFTAELASTPITGNQSHYYQVMTGRRPECFGFFDTLMPHEYSVEEKPGGRDRPPETLITLLSSAGWNVNYNEIAPANLESSICAWAKTASAFSCLIVKCAYTEPLIGNMTTDLAQAIRIARTVVGEHGLFAIFSDAQPILVKQFVNLNNFLASTGIIDRNGPGNSIDWSNSLAYYMGHGQLYVNLLGRDAKGIIKRQQEYDEVCNILVEVLPRKLRDPQTDQPVIANVSRKEDFYSSDYLFCAPDLVVTFHPGYIPSPRSIYLDFDETIFTTPPTGTAAINGAHPDSINGFLIASTPAFKRGVTFTASMPLTAIAPTLLHALQVKHALMDSDPQQECFDPRYLYTHPLHTTTRSQELSGEEEELILSRLRDLGYI
ncbi:hypothetical protein KSF_019190 [Reticulibacter mediterranei]|uniref:Uncharacterized protein n=1 Tax=Reticulibacter mediterranei TaxID=2778369 RepID=A0A8J3ICP0_9CHLR|nr:hypothetical protein [Reticulibacter mediterranei]GHO91871.1 hypothetical protein KSF_019190 [Reticulibacter mediterranei]